MKKSKIILTIVISSLLLVTLVACGGGEGGSSNELNLMTWAEFIPREIIEEFQEETGIKVNYKEVASNEDMQSLLEASGDQYDLAVVTDYMVDILRRNENIKKFDKEQIPNFENLNDVYQNKYYDENNEYSIPYGISISLLLTNPEAVKALGADPITSYEDLWQEELKDSLVVIDGSIELMGLALKTLGYEYNETNPQIVEEAKEKLFGLSDNIMRYEVNTPEDSLLNGEAVAGFMYSNQVVKGVEAGDGELEAVFPKEGMPMYIDSFVMSAKAPNSDNAHKFLNFLMEPEVSAKISALTSFTNANTKAQEFLPEDFKNNPVLNLSDDVAENTSLYISVENVLEEYEHIYSEFKMQ